MDSPIKSENDNGASGNDESGAWHDYTPIIPKPLLLSSHGKSLPSSHGLTGGSTPPNTRAGVTMDSPIKSGNDKGASGNDESGAT